MFNASTGNIQLKEVPIKNSDLKANLEITKNRLDLTTSLLLPLVSSANMPSYFGKDSHARSTYLLLKRNGCLGANCLNCFHGWPLRITKVLC
jgi:hypothetical protein